MPAVRQGFIPDSISADLFADTPYTVGINLANVMSKFLCLGVPLEDVVRRGTTLQSGEDDPAPRVREVKRWFDRRYCRFRNPER